ncbi:MAG TPA: hypothetical protein VLI05_01725 [Candidatus Saccharimonadia bacterium]|nr:hypothetical protein [Candidatus Saccharimonadia bacterium]
MERSELVHSSRQALLLGLLAGFTSLAGGLMLTAVTQGLTLLTIGEVGLKSALEGVVVFILAALYFSWLRRATDLPKPPPALPVTAAAIMSLVIYLLPPSAWTRGILYADIPAASTFMCIEATAFATWFLASVSYRLLKQA